MEKLKCLIFKKESSGIKMADGLFPGGGGGGGAVWRHGPQLFAIRPPTHPTHRIFSTDLKFQFVSNIRSFIALFNNMRNLKFKSPPTVAFVTEVSGNKELEFNGAKRSRSSLWLVDFDTFYYYFCRFLFFTVLWLPTYKYLNYHWRQRKTQLFVIILIPDSACYWSKTGPAKKQVQFCSLTDPFRNSRTVPCKQKASPVRFSDRIRLEPVPCKHSLKFRPTNDVQKPTRNRVF